MKANSIDEIREHLAKGGRVEGKSGLYDAEDWVVKSCDDELIHFVINGHTHVSVPWDRLRPGGLELLPLEEKEPVAVAMAYEQVCEALKQKRRVRFFWRDFPDRSFIVPSVFGKDGIVVCNEHDASNQWTVYWDWVTERGYCQAEEPVDYGTQNAINATCGDPIPNQDLLSILRGTATLPESVSAQGHIYHKAQLEAADVIERQQKRIEELEAKLASLKTCEPHGRQKGLRCPHDTNGDGDCHRCFRDNECLFVAMKQRIRTRLLHGQWPEMQDLMDWWAATTGERIEWGRRCVICDGQGRLKSNSGDKRPGYEYTGCPGCSSGYSVRPTWMGEGK